MGNGKEIPDQVRNDSGGGRNDSVGGRNDVSSRTKNVILNWIQDLEIKGGISIGKRICVFYDK